MRIIAGELKGRKITVPSGADLRPTMDRVREAIFSSLASSIVLGDYVVADFYAGTGALGFEALSRGAKQCIFVESNKELARNLLENAQTFKMKDRVQVVQSDVFKSLSGVREQLERLSKQSEAKGIVLFADPPYTAHPELVIFEKFAEAGLFDLHPIFILGTPTRIGEIDPRQILDKARTPLSVTYQKGKRYGDTVITFYGF